MAARALVLIGGSHGLGVGICALVVGLLAFPVLAVSSMVFTAVSGVWLVLPSLLLVTGVGLVLGWLVLREDALPTYDVDPSTSWWPDR